MYFLYINYVYIFYIYGAYEQWRKIPKFRLIRHARCKVETILNSPEILIIPMELQRIEWTSCFNRIPRMYVFENNNDDEILYRNNNVDL